MIQNAKNQNRKNKEIITAMTMTKIIITVTMKIITMIMKTIRNQIGNRLKISKR